MIPYLVSADVIHTGETSITTHSYIAGFRCRLMAMIVLIIATFLINAPVQAHELRPAIVTAVIDKSGDVEVRLSLNLEARIAGIGPDHSDTSASDKAPVYDRLRAATPGMLENAFAPTAQDLIADLQLLFDGKATDLTLERLDIPPIGDIAIARTSTVVLTGVIPTGAESMIWSAPQLGNNVIRVTRSGETTPYFSAFLSAGETSQPIALDGVVEQSDWSSFFKYLQIGFEHILPKGLDHILFIVSLFLLSPFIRPLLWQVTSFTLAHSVTLGLSIYGLVSVPAAIVEPLIAASIAFVAIENLFTDRLHRWRPAVVFGFGLLHGLGFAGVLSEIGLPQAQFVTGLIAFNVGVELGQIAVLAVCFIVIGLQFRHRHWYRQAFAMPASLVVACVATYWFVERISL